MDKQPHLKLDQENLQLKMIELEKNEKHLLERLRLDSSLLLKILDALPINIFLEDREGRTIFANKQACLLNGMELEELVGKTVFDFFPINIAEKQRNIDLEVWKERSLLTKEVKVGFQGKESYMVTGKTIIELPESSEEFLLGFGLDITEKKEAEEKIEKMAYHDALTGLPNRWFVHSYLQNDKLGMKKSRAMLGVLLIDLDHFKVINDSLGHLAGDLLLQAVGKRLRSVLREEIIIARFGGDEFLVLIPNLANIEEAYEISQYIMKVMGEPFFLFNQKFNISPSIGISLSPLHGEDFNTLIKNADLAMYHSKERGRNCYSLFSPAMKEDAMTRMDMEILLRQALEKREFVLHYQPKLDLNSGQVYGMEALIRWKSKDNVTLYPDAFIAIAEESGLIVPIGAWVLREACHQCKKWHDAGYNQLTVSVNISPGQFRKQDLEELIQSVLHETGLPPWALEIELTESTVMKEPAKAAMILRRLKAIGISISIDDFGTGFSSLSYLKNFPIDVLKIDKSFIMNLECDETNSSIATAVISLAHNLKLKVVAEGVETSRQMTFLKDGGCDYIQGYHFSKPIEINHSIHKVLSELDNKTKMDC